MMIDRMLIVAAGLLVLSACTPNHVYQNLYEGIRVRNQLESLPDTSEGKTELPPYSQYEEQRQKQLNSVAPVNGVLWGEMI